MIEIKKYESIYKNLWDDFVSKSKNGTFLFYRDYMEYHKSRFNDNSLMFYNEKDELIAILPANIENKKLVTHGGLTYGGIIVNRNVKTPDMMDIFDSVINYCKNSHIDEILYKCVPCIYHDTPVQSDLYCLFRYNATIHARNISSVVCLDKKIQFQKRRVRQIKKAINNNILVLESTDYEKYWNILNDTLMTRHNTKPVHTREEILKLHKLFPDNIRLFCASRNQDILAGVLIYETEYVAHAQYICASNEGRELGALDIIFDELINRIFKEKKYFDFGTSNEENGRYLNVGLINQKEGFGASSIVYDQYSVRV